MCFTPSDQLAHIHINVANASEYLAYAFEDEGCVVRLTDHIDVIKVSQDKRTIR